MPGQERMKKVRLIDIANELGVSAVTVHNALTGNKGVSAALREKICSTAKQMGYDSAQAQQRKEPEQVRKIGTLISERYLAEYTTYYWKIYQELALAAAEYKCMTSVEILKYEQEDTYEFPQMAVEGMVDGIIVLGEISRPYMRELKSHLHVPLVFLDVYDRDLVEDAVIADNFYGMYQMTQYLFDRGLRNLPYVGSLHASSSIMDRYCGFTRAHLERGLAVRKEWVLEDRDGRGFIHVELPAELPEAFVCNCDLTAGAVIRQLEERGLRVPEDVSVTGFDNYAYPVCTDQRITTYEVNTRRMAQLALEKILRRLEDPNRKRSLEIVSGVIIEKNSVRQ